MNAYTRNIRRFRFHQYTYTWTRDFIIESKLSAKFIEVLEIGNAINRTNRNWKFFHCMAVAYFYFSRSRFFFIHSFSWLLQLSFALHLFDGDAFRACIAKQQQQQQRKWRYHVPCVMIDVISCTVQLCSPSRLHTKCERAWIM